MMQASNFIKQPQAPPIQFKEIVLIINLNQLSV